MSSQPGEVRGSRNVMIHVVSVFMLFLLPELIFNLGTYSQGMNMHVRWGAYFKGIVYIVVFYVNYFLIIDATLGRSGRKWRFVVFNLLVIVGALMLMRFLLPMLNDRPRPPKFSDMPLRFRYAHVVSGSLRDIVMIVLTIALSVAVRLSDKWARLERRRREMAAALRDEELRGLKNQLNPHFLFNTLNSIYALIDVDTREAQRTVHRLSGMLRHMLYENESMSTLGGEIAFTRNYIDLMRVRMSRTNVVFDADVADYADRSVPPLIFLTLVENALKFGNTGRGGEDVIISVCAGESGIRFASVNGFDPEMSRDGGGIGIANLRRRLQLIYGTDAKLRVGVSNDGKVFEACMSVPFLECDKRMDVSSIRN